MLPRRPRRLFLLALISGNAFLIFWLFVGGREINQADSLDPYEDPDYVDDVALKSGRKMRIFGAHPQPPKWQSEDDLIIRDSNEDLKRKDEIILEERRDLEIVKIPRYQQRQKVVKSLRNDKVEQGVRGDDYNGDETEEEEEEDYGKIYDIDDKDTDRHYDFHKMQRNKKKALDLFPRPAEEETNIDPQAMNGSHYAGFDTRFVHHCITRDVIGKIPLNIKTENFSLVHRESPEDTARRKASFHKVFEERSWGKGWDKAYDRLDASGRGAQLSWAQEFIATLQLLINDIKTKFNKSKVRVLDVPCGDMAWMSRFLVTRNDVDYLGVDIVPELIDNHRKAYRSYPWKFRLLDLIDTPLNESYDIIINRMLLQHLYYPDVFKMLNAFSNSGSTFLITTSFLRVSENTELSLKDNPGRVRKLNLEIPPLSLTPPLCVTRDGPPDTFEGWDHFAGVWRLPLQRIPMCRKPHSMKLAGTHHVIYSCVKWGPS